MPHIGTSIGIGYSGAARFGALGYVSPSKVLQYVRADAGITLNGSRVAAWADRSAAGKDYTQGTAGNQPLFSATGGPNSTPIVRIDDTARFMTSTLTTPAPGTTPTGIWIVGRTTFDGTGRRIVSDTTNAKRLVYQRVASPNFAMYDGAEVNNNTGMSVNTWGRIYALFTNSTGDLLKCRSTSVTGANAGSQAADVGRLLGSSVVASNALFDFCEVLYLNAALSAAEQTALDAYVTSRYGSGLT